MAMREIIFRGKRLDNGEWITGCLVKYAYDSTPYIGYLDAWGDGIYKVDPSTTGQFTGLTSNGKKIFEGDIVKNDCGYIGQIVFKACSYYIEWKSGNFTIDLYVMADNLEIIGNIHDNPELLEGEG